MWHKVVFVAAILGYSAGHMHPPTDWYERYYNHGIIPISRLASNREDPLRRLNDYTKDTGYDGMISYDVSIPLPDDLEEERKMFGGRGLLSNINEKITGLTGKLKDRFKKRASRIREKAHNLRNMLHNVAHSTGERSPDLTYAGDMESSEQASQGSFDAETPEFSEQSSVEDEVEEEAWLNPNDPQHLETDAEEDNASIEDDNPPREQGSALNMLPFNYDGPSTVEEMVNPYGVPYYNQFTPVYPYNVYPYVSPYAYSNYVRSPPPFYRQPRF